MTRPAELVVLDTSAVLALRSDEPGASEVEAILLRASGGHAQVYLSFMSRMEILYRVEADEGREAALAAIRLLDAMPVAWVNCEPAILEGAARLKARGGLSVADAWIAATAMDRGATLVHRDPEFTALAALAQVLLPAEAG